MMASLFRLVLSCCLSRRTKELDIPDDRSRLIPATEPSINGNPCIVVVDHQRLKQRLDNIVRLKEGQMVNVTSEIPFNLHNKPLPALDPSSSRSVSVSTNSQSPSTPIRHHRKVRIRSPLQRTPSHSAEPSPARSHSKSSSKEEDNVDGLEEHAHPILNVRLVRGCPPGYGAIARRGRALVRAGGGHLDGMFEREESSDSGKGKERDQDVNVHGQGGSPLDGDEQVGLGTVGDGVNHAGPGDAHPASSELFVIEPAPRGQDDEDSDQNTPTTQFCPPLHPLPTSNLNFRIHDMGALTLSFGD